MYAMLMLCISCMPDKKNRNKKTVTNPNNEDIDHFSKSKHHQKYIIAQA